MGDTPSSFRATKEGIEARQDAEIRALRADFAEYRSNDIITHNELKDSVRDVSASIKTYTFAGKIVWSGIGLLFAVVAGLFGWIVAEIGSHDDQIQALRGGQMATEQRDFDLQESCDEVRQDIRDLRRQLQEHQVNRRIHHPHSRGTGD